MLRVACTLLFLLAATACLGFTALTFLGHWTMPIVLTGSMAPAIERGDVVLAEPVSVDEVRTGDVIVFIAPNDSRVTVHRVESITHDENGPTMTTRGDANEEPDPWQLRMDRTWVHRVRFEVPHLGGVIRATHSVASLHILLGLGSAALVIGVGLRSIWAPTGATVRSRRRPRLPDATPTVSAVVVIAVLGSVAATGLTGPGAPSADAALVAATSAAGPLASGTLATPTSPTCRWSSATALRFGWTLPAGGLETSTLVQRSSSAGGATTTVATVTPAALGTATVTVPAPVTTNRFHRLRTSRGTWTSADSTELRSDACAGAIAGFAGNGSAGATGNGGAATSATLSQPRGVAVAVTGETYIADTGNNRIRRVAADGTITTFAGGPAASACSYSGSVAGLGLNAPRGVAVDATGNVYVADTGANCIRRISPAGIVSSVAGGGSTTACSAVGAASSASLSAPSGVAVDGAGAVYIADTSRNCVRRVSAGAVSRVAGGGTSTGCAGSVAASTVSLSGPIGVAVDGAGAVYIADTGRSCVRRVASGTATVAMGGGATTTCAGTAAASAIGLSAPEGVVVDAAGSVYVTDTGRRCVRAATAGTARPISFSGTNSSTGDGGPAIAATARTPSGLALTAAGDLLVSDRSATAGSNRVRRVIDP